MPPRFGSSLDRAALYSPSKSISEHGFGGNAIADFVAMVHVTSSNMKAANILVVILIGELLGVSLSKETVPEEQHRRFDMILIFP
jgi:hypothetical protein